MRFMREFIIIIVIIIIVFTIDHITGKNLSYSVAWMRDGMISIENKLKENNENEAQNEFFELKEKWDEECEKLSLYVEHNELEKVGNDIVIIESNFRQNESDELFENIADLKYMLSHIEEKNQLKLKNIF